MLGALKGSEYVVALEIDGKSWSTEKLSSQLESWQMNGRDVAFLIGGPEGLSLSVATGRISAGLCPRSRYPIHWCVCWWPSNSTGPGPSLRITPTTGPVRRCIGEP